MKHLLVSMLALALTGCAAIAPAAATPSPSATPQVIVQTVLVTVMITQQATEVPTITPAPTQTARIRVVTATAEATTSPTTASTEATATAPATSPTATLPPGAGGNLFANLTRSSDHFSPGCSPDTITFGVSTADTTVRDVILYYRLENQSSGAISDWKNAGLMTSDQNGNFTMDFAASSVNPDLRSQKAWFDYQFVAINRAGAVAGRSAKIVKQIAYTADCPG